MVKIKAWILTADWVVFTASGYSFVDILSTMISGNLALSSMENFVKLLFSMAGLIYLCVRIYNTIMKSRLERRMMLAEIMAKELENHKNNDYKHFIKQTEDKSENLKK